MTAIIRDVCDQDLKEALILNEAVVPAVNSIPLEKLRWFAEEASYFRVAMHEGRLGAFLIGLRPGIDYESENYRWFCANYDDFGYIDRVAVADHARRQGLGTAMYDDFREFLPQTAGVMTCEIYIDPPAITSIRFHERYGFTRVGTQKNDNGSKEVALMARDL
ncbi:MAG: GNAT family N-acetyltransferase [Gammaproteobacteria bacterium]|nr:GNAT family N-acetyltransferase [Gammaproteobacteria bacterium]